LSVLPVNLRYAVTQLLLSPDVSRRTIVSHSLTRLFSAFLLRFVAIVAFASVLCEPILAQDTAVNGAAVVDSLSLGFDGVGRVGNWLPVRLKVHGLAASREHVLTVIASDPRGDQCESKVAAATSDATGSLDIHGVFMTGRLDGPVRVRLEDANGEIQWQHLVSCRAAGRSAAVQSTEADAKDAVFRS
jgi:hypothetical protein